MDSFQLLIDEQNLLNKQNEDLIKEKDEKVNRNERMIEDFEAISKTFCKKCMNDEVELDLDDEMNNKNIDSMDFMEKDCNLMNNIISQFQ